MDASKAAFVVATVILCEGAVADFYKFVKGQGPKEPADAGSSIPFIVPLELKLGSIQINPALRSEVVLPFQLPHAHAG